MYPQSTVDIARQLSDLGILDRENAQICGVSIRSIRHRAYSRSMAQGGSMNAVSSWSRGKRRSWRSTPVTSRAGFSIPMDAVG
jgi:hypothetical protein